MGSSGSGRFSDYSGKLKTGSGDGASGGSSGSDKCTEAFTTSLEDVAIYSYFTKYGTVPPVGTQLEIAIRGRIVAIIGTDSVGALPTQFNYLAGCIQDGFTYAGVVTASSNGANPNIVADFVAN